MPVGRVRHTPAAWRLAAGNCVIPLSTLSRPWFRSKADVPASVIQRTKLNRSERTLSPRPYCARIFCAREARVARMSGTLQDRLIKKLRLRGISSMEAANAFAPAFVAD